MLSLLYFGLFRNCLETRETRETCFPARFRQKQSSGDPHSSHPAAIQPQAAVQPRPAMAHHQDQSVQPPARPLQFPLCSHETAVGDGRGRTSRLHSQGDREEGLWGLVQRARQRLCRSSRWIVPQLRVPFGASTPSENDSMRAKHSKKNLVFWSVWTTKICIKYFILSCFP